MVPTRTKIFGVVFIIVLIGVGWKFFKPASPVQPVVEVTPTATETTAPKSAVSDVPALLWLDEQIGTPKPARPVDQSEGGMSLTTPLIPSQIQSSVEEICGKCTDEIYNQDCINSQDKTTWTCVAGTWVNFGKPASTVTTTSLETSKKVTSNIAPPFTTTSKKQGIMICGDAMCSSPFKVSIGWKTVQDAINAISEYDFSFRNQVVPATEYDLTSLGGGNGVPGVVSGTTNKSFMLDGTTLSSRSYDDAKGFWVIGPTPSAEWVAFIQSKGLGIIY
jgi:hypothetical protein